MSKAHLYGHVIGDVLSIALLVVVWHHSHWSVALTLTLFAIDHALAWWLKQIDPK